MSEDKTSPNPESSKSKSQKLDLITKQKIDKHLKDINDVITEEDIINVNTNIHSGEGNETNDEPKNMVRTELERKESHSIWEIEE